MKELTREKFKMDSYEEFDFYEIKQWLNESAKGRSHFTQSLSYNTHPFATSIIESYINRLPPAYFTRNCHHLLCGHTSNNNKLALFLRLKERNTCVVPYDIYSEMLLYYHLEYESDLADLKQSLKTRKEERSWKFGKLVQQVCRQEKMDKIKEIAHPNLDWHSLSQNTHPCVIDFLRENKRIIVWRILSKNPSDAAVDLLLESEIDWFAVSSNTNDRITARFPEMKRKLSISELCSNTSDFVVKWLLEDNELYNSIIWSRFCSNPNDLAVEHIYSLSLVNPNDRRIDWGNLCRNTNRLVFQILRNNKHKINWPIFLQNPICFEYDYEKMKCRAEIFKEELLNLALSPERVMAAIKSAREENEDDFEVISRIDF